MTSTDMIDSHPNRRRLAAALAVVIVLGLTACGTDSPETASAAAQTDAAPETVPRPTDDRDGTVRTQPGSMRLRCVGQGETTVLLIAGWGGGGDGWDAIEPEVAEGVLLLDASPVTWPAAVCAVPDDGTDAAASYQALCAGMRDPMQNPERLDVFAAFADAAAIESLGDVPMAVVTAARRSTPGLVETEAARLNAVWDAGVERWAALSTASEVVVVEDASHHIHMDHPRLVVDELLALLPPAS